LLVEDIDGWYAKIRAAGYRMQTEYVWTCASLGRSFLFYDQDGNMIQLWEASQAVGWG
jgi:predicted enzyme related to lactoylglutathione lyase